MEAGSSSYPKEKIGVVIINKPFDLRENLKNSGNFKRNPKIPSSLTKAEVTSESGKEGVECGIYLSNFLQNEQEMKFLRLTFEDRHNSMNGEEIGELQYKYLKLYNNNISLGKKVIALSIDQKLENSKSFQKNFIKSLKFTAKKMQR